MNKQFVPKWLLLILLILVLGNLTIYYWISESPRIEDLLINLSATFLGILVTLFFIDRIIKYYERKEWEEFEGIISNQLIDILFTLCNILNISSDLWQEWIRIFNTKKEKIKQYIKIFQTIKINKDYINTIIMDDHLIDFFSSGYNGTYKRLDDFFRLYNNKLSAEQNIQVINLKTNISNLINNMNFFQSLNFIIKEYKVPIQENNINDFMQNARETISTIKKLLDSI